MNEREETRQDERLQRTIAALRTAEVAPGPPDEAVEAVLTAGRIRGPKAMLKGRFTMNRITKLAAAVLIIAGIAALIAFLTIGHGGATVAWADVQEYIRNARTVTMKAVMQQEGAPEIKVDVMIMAPGLVRQRLSIPNLPTVTQILHVLEGEMLVLTEDSKEAFRINLAGLPEEVRKRHEEGDFLARIKKLIGESEIELGEKEIAGQLAKGYRVEKDNQVATIWADAYTGDPLEMEMIGYQGQAKVIMSDFEFDKELDESLFSLELPDGYTLKSEQPLEIKEASTADIVAFLKFWAEARGGTFPATLAETEWVKDCPPHMAALLKDLSENEVFERVKPLGSARLFLQMHPETQNQYAGSGVKLGDAGRAVFWYKPEGSETYKVIYGDLRVEDVAEEDLPEVPAPQPAQPEEQPEPTPVGEDGVLELSHWERYTEGDGTAEMIDDPDGGEAKVFKLTITGPKDVAVWRTSLGGLTSASVYKVSARGKGNGAECSSKVRVNVGGDRMAVGIFTNEEWEYSCFSAPFRETHATLWMELKDLKGDGPAEVYVKDLEVRKLQK